MASAFDIILGAGLFCFCHVQSYSLQIFQLSSWCHDLVGAPQNSLADVGRLMQRNWFGYVGIRKWEVFQWTISVKRESSFQFEYIPKAFVIDTDYMETLFWNLRGHVSYTAIYRVWSSKSNKYNCRRNYAGWWGVHRDSAVNTPPPHALSNVKQYHNHQILKSVVKYCPGSLQSNPNSEEAHFRV